MFGPATQLVQHTGSSKNDTQCSEIIPRGFRSGPKEAHLEGSPMARRGQKAGPYYSNP